MLEMTELKIGLTGLVVFMTIYMLVGWELKARMTDHTRIVIVACLVPSIIAFVVGSLFAIWRW